MMATVKDLSRVSKAVRDAPPHDKASLVRADERRNQRLEPGSKHLRNPFDDCVLQGNRSEVLGHSRTVLFG